jgi:hypothetical protein
MPGSPTVCVGPKGVLETRPVYYTVITLPTHAPDILYSRQIILHSCHISLDRYSCQIILHSCHISLDRYSCQIILHSFHICLDIYSCQIILTAVI